MKQKFFTLFATLLCCMTMFADGDPEESQLEVYTEFVEETKTLTYYYDTKRLERTGVTEVYDPIGNPNAVRFTGYYEKVYIAVIDPSMKNAPLTSYKKMFYGNYNLETYVDQSLSKMQILKGLENLNTTIVVDMGSMFRGCTSLASLDLSSFNTGNVTDMKQMFEDCYYLASLNLSSFNTENVTDMRHMFMGCSHLASLNLNSFNTENVTHMGSMFDGCSALTSLDLSSFNTENVTNMLRVFRKCSSLKTIYCDYDWSTTAATSDYMFDGCISLVGGKGTPYDEGISNKTYARPDGGTGAPGYFTGTKDVYTEFVESTGTLTYYHDTKRSKRTGKTELYDPVGSPNAVRFAGYSEKVTKAVIDPSMKDAPLTSMRMMFYGRSDPETLKTYNLSNLTTIEGLENLNTSIVTDVNNMFYMCSSLTSLDLSSFNTSNVTDMRNMFLGCNALQAVDLTSFDVSKVTTMQGMFGSCRELTTICCNTDWRTSPNLTNSYLMFAGCNKIVGDKGTTFINDNNRDATYAHPDGGTSDPGYFSIYHKGDADGNGVVNAADIVAISNYMMGNPPAGFSKASADVNLDGVINIADIVALANILLND